MGAYFARASSDHYLRSGGTTFDIFDRNASDIITVTTEKEVYEPGENITFNVRLKYDIALFGTTAPHVTDANNNTMFSVCLPGVFFWYHSGRNYTFEAVEEYHHYLKSFDGEFIPGSYHFYLESFCIWEEEEYSRYSGMVAFRVNGTVEDEVQEEDVNGTGAKNVTEPEDNSTIGNQTDNSTGGWTLEKDNSTIEPENNSVNISDNTTVCQGDANKTVENIRESSSVNEQEDNENTSSDHTQRDDGGPTDDIDPDEYIFIPGPSHNSFEGLDNNDNSTSDDNVSRDNDDLSARPVIFFTIISVVLILGIFVLTFIFLILGKRKRGPGSIDEDR